MKLTNVMRSTIADRIVNKVRRPREVKLNGWEHALALRLVKQRYGDDVFERCRALPEGWLRPEKTIGFEHGLNLPSKRRMVRKVELAEYAPLPMNFHGDWNLDVIGSKLHDEVTRLFEARIELEDDVELLRNQILAALNAFTTVEYLAETWPEGYAELPAEMMSSPVNLPAPRIADLNERIEAAKAA